MADLALARSGALDGIVDASPADTACRLDPLPPKTRFILRGRSGTAEAATDALGFALPVDACRSVSAGDVAALWLGPDEWLVIGPEAAHGALGRGLADAFGGRPHAMVDVSHRNTGLTVSGPQAAYVLNHGCPLDLTLAAFPVGMCTRTLVGRTEAVLWRTAAETFHVEVWRSFAAYLAGFLVEARREFE